MSSRPGAGGGWKAPLRPRQKLRETGNNIAVRNQHAHALGKQEGIVLFTHGQAYSILCSRNTKDRVCLLTQEVGEILLEHQCDAGKIPEGWNHPARLQLREKTRGETNLLSEFDQAHRTLQTEPAYFFSDLFCFNGSLYCRLVYRIDRRVGFVRFGHRLRRPRWIPALPWPTCHGAQDRSLTQGQNSRQVDGVVLHFGCRATRTERPLLADDLSS